MLPEPHLPTTPDAAAADRLHRMLGGCFERTASARRSCETILATHARSAQADARIVEESRRLVRDSRKLLRRSGGDDGWPPPPGPAG